MARPKPAIPLKDFHARIPATTYETLGGMAGQHGMTVPQFVRVLCEITAARADEMQPVIDAQKAGQGAVVLEGYRAFAARGEAAIKAELKPPETEEPRS